MTSSIMITTLNRVEELRRTLPILERLDPAPAEVWVVADGCTDETVAYVRESHPRVRLIVHEKSMGSVASRAEIMAEVGGDLVLALDDDSYPEQADCLARLADLFEARPDLAIATFPQRSDEYPESLEQSDFGLERRVRSFPNSGACLRVSTYRQLDGFPGFFFHAYEEPDYALQCVAHGKDVVYYPHVTIRHHYSGLMRNEIRTHHRHARNELWSTLMRCPFPQSLGMIAWRIFSQGRYAVKRGPSWVIREPLWWWQALRGLGAAWCHRNPVSWSGYRRWLRYENDAR